MKKSCTLIAALTFISLLTFFGCKVSEDNSDSSDSTSSEDTSGGSNNSGSGISKEFWGTWIRMDTGAEYVINDKTVTVNGKTSSGIGVITKESENILKYGSEDIAPRLFRKGGSNRSFSAKLSGFDSSLARAAGIGTSVIGRRQNKNNASDKQEVKPDSKGVLSFTDAVSEDVQNIEVQTSEGSKVSVDVIPQYDGENIGTIPLTSAGKYALKTTYTIDTKLDDYMYGNDYAEYDITLKIENISEVNCGMSFYTISCEDSNLTTTFTTTGNIRTLLPGKSEEIKGKVSYGKLEAEYKDVVLNIKIEDSLTDDVWKDSITLRFYRGRVPLAVNAQVVGGSSNTKLNGFVIYPDSRSRWFSVPSGQSSTIWIPYSQKDYTLVFSGATDTSEMKYSFNFRNKSKLADLTTAITRDEIRAYEDNNTFNAAYSLGTFTNNVKAALTYGDLDYYVINNKNEPMGYIDSIKVDTTSMRTSYYLNQTLNTEGLVVKAVYEGGQEADVSEYAKIGTVDMTTTGTKSLKVSYTENGITKTEEIDITVSKALVSSIKVEKTPSKLVYYTGQEFDPSGIVIKATFQDGQVVDVTDSVTYEGFNSNAPAATQTITVVFETGGSRFTDSFDIEVKPYFTGIKCEQKPTKLVYYTGQEFDSTGIVVKATAYDGQTVDVTDSVTYEGFDSNASAAIQTITVVFEKDGSRFTDSFGIEVKPYFTGIKCEQKPAKLVYYTGQDFDSTGIVVTATLINGQTVDVTDSVTYEGFNSNAPTATQTITVVFEKDGIRYTDSFDIEVKLSYFTGIKCEQKPAKLVYYTGQEFDSTGIVVNATVINGHTVDVTDSVTYEGFNSNAPAATQIITVVFEKNGSRFTDSFDIEVRQVVLTGLRCDSKPTKQKYYTGQKFNPAGMQITALYNSGEEKDRTKQCTNDFDSSNATDSKVVTVSYTENGITKSTTFTVIIDSLILPKGFVFVDGGTVTGSKAYDASSDGNYIFVEGRTVTIQDMYVSDHEVTQAEYAKYCKYGSSSPSSSYGVGDNYPAYYVNWYDAVVYCNLRSIDEELTPAYKIGEETDPRKWSGIVVDAENGYCGPSSSNSTWNALTYDKTANGYRLPTEAEWEYIAREAGTSTTTYSGSDTIDDVAWCTSNSSRKTHEVKGKIANSLGIYDMSGNVWEWCYDWYSSINSSTADTGASSGSFRVTRGGSWSSSFASSCTVSRRGLYYPDNRDDCIGFRVVRTVK